MVWFTAHFLSFRDSLLNTVPLLKKMYVQNCILQISCSDQGHSCSACQTGRLKSYEEHCTKVWRRETQRNNCCQFAYADGGALRGAKVINLVKNLVYKCTYI